MHDMTCKYCGDQHAGNDCIRSGDPERPYRCARCDETFLDASEVAVHMELHCSVLRA